jgi:hypothetical protein
MSLTGQAPASNSRLTARHGLEAQTPDIFDRRSRTKPNLPLRRRIITTR